MEIIILCIIFGFYFLWKSYSYVDAFGDVGLGEEVPFIVDINYFIMMKAGSIWFTFWLLKLIAIAIGADYNIFSSLDIWMVSVIGLTFVGGYLSLTISKFFGWLSLISVAWPLVL